MMTRPMHSAAVLLCAAALSSFSARAQVGKWETHTSMREIRDLTFDASSIWAATSGGVFRYTPGQESFEKWTNVNGLTSIDATAIERDASGATLVGLSTGAINIRSAAGDWTSVLDIQRASNVTNHGITAMRAAGDLVYVCTEFGLTVFDPARREFRATYLKFGDVPSQTAVSDVLVSGDSIWVAVANSVAAAALSSPNLQNPDSWHVYSTSDGLPGKPVACLAKWNGVVVAGTGQGMYRFGDTGWKYYPPAIDTREVSRLIPVGDDLYAVNTTNMYVLHRDNTWAQIGAEINAPAYPSLGMLTDVAIMPSGAAYAATRFGLARHDAGTTWTMLHPDGPASNFIASLTVDDQGRLWSGSGRDNAGSGAYMYDGTSWSNWDMRSDTAWHNNSVYVTAPDLDGNMWFGTWGGGLLRRDAAGVFTTFNPKNGVLLPRAIDTDPNWVVISGARADAKGNMWFLNYLETSRTGDTLLSCRLRDGSWRFYTAGPISGAKQGYSLAIDQYGTKWFAVQNSIGALLGFNENGRPDNPSSFWYRLDASDKSLLNGDVVQCLAVDLQGTLWVGTRLGIRAITNPRTASRVDRTCYTTICNIEGQSVKCIAVDAVNNKWLGTENGITVLTSDGYNIVAQYSTDNSPLLSNNVQTMVVHPVTGVAWIGTDKGLCSLTTPYVQPQTAGSKLRVSPNPFRPGADTQVQIDGLPEGSSLKIIALSGDVIANRTTPGGSVGFWDGRDDNGNLAPSGVYFVAGFNADGTQVALGKVAVVRK